MQIVVDHPGEFVGVNHDSHNAQRFLCKQVFDSPAHDHAVHARTGAIFPEHPHGLAIGTYYLFIGAGSTKVLEVGRWERLAHGQCLAIPVGFVEEYRVIYAASAERIPFQEVGEGLVVSGDFVSVCGGDILEEQPVQVLIGHKLKSRVLIALEKC